MPIKYEPNFFVKNFFKKADVSIVCQGGYQGMGKVENMRRN